MPSLRTGTHGAWSVTMRSTCAHSLRAAAGSVAAPPAPRWPAGRREGRRTRRGCRAGGILVKGAAAQDGEEEVRCGGEVGTPSGEAHLDLAAGVAEPCEELGQRALCAGGPVSEIFEQPDKVGAHRLSREVLDDPNGHRHVRGAGILRQPHAPWPCRGRARSRPWRRPCRGSSAGGRGSRPGGSGTSRWPGRGRSGGAGGSGRGRWRS